MGGDLPFGIPKGPGSAMATPGYHKIPPFQGLRGSCIRKIPYSCFQRFLDILKSCIPFPRTVPNPSFLFPGPSQVPHSQGDPEHSQIPYSLDIPKSPIPIPSTFQIPHSHSQHIPNPQFPFPWDWSPVPSLSPKASGIQGFRDSGLTLEPRPQLTSLTSLTPSEPSARAPTRAAQGRKRQGWDGPVSLCPFGVPVSSMSPCPSSMALVPPWLWCRSVPLVSPCPKAVVSHRPQSCGGIG